MSYSPVDVGSMREPYAREPQQQKQLELTAEEQRVLKECSSEGIYQRALPMSIAFGTGGFMMAKAGPLMHARFGVKPAVIGFGMLGYFIGRFSYTKICFQRVLEVPDGNLKKFLDQGLHKREYSDSSSDFYATIDVPKSQPPIESSWDGQRVNSDIEIPSTSYYDNVPSEYYKDNSQILPEEQTPKNFTSYDDLRRRNRQEYSNRLYPEQNTQPRYNPSASQDPQTRRPPPPPQPTSSNGPRTKYGDDFE